jgi:hypothetical protein
MILDDFNVKLASNNFRLPPPPPPAKGIIEGPVAVIGQNFLIQQLATENLQLAAREGVLIIPVCIGLTEVSQLAQSHADCGDANHALIALPL